MTLPGVPTRDFDSIDKTRQLQSQVDELRKTLFGVVRSSDVDGNQVIGPDLGGAGWGVALPHSHVPAYPCSPYLGAAGYAWFNCFTASFKPASQQINVHVRWSVQEAIVANTAIGEFEMRWNKGMAPGTRGEAITDSILFDSWDSGSAGTKGTDGTLIRSNNFVWPQDGSAPLVGYLDPAWVTISVWAHIRTATGTANDIARVAPLALYQSGYGQE